jgi:pilus assembly protein CpaB
VSTRTALVGMLALVFGLSAAVGVTKFRNSLLTAQPAEDTVTVVIAAVDVPRGRQATADMLTTKQYPKSFAPNGVVASLDDAVNRVPRETLIKDEPVFEARLTPKGTSPGFANVIPPGMRAMSIKTPTAATIGGGFILPGDKVDVVFTQRSQTGADQEQTGGGTTTILVQLVEVLAINQKSDAASDNKMDVKELQTATLLVSPEQMQRIELAQNLGTLTLTLRNQNDKTPVTVGPFHGKDIRYTIGRPFTDQLKDASDAVAKAWEAIQVEYRKTAKEIADRQKAERERAAKEEAERERQRQATPSPPAVQQPSVPLKVRTIRSNVPGSVDVPSDGRQ